LLVLMGVHFTHLKGVVITGSDDAYMSIPYADTFLHGHGIAWNRDGVQTYGATRMLYLFVTFASRFLLPKESATHRRLNISVALSIRNIRCRRKIMAGKLPESKHENVRCPPYTVRSGGNYLKSRTEAIYPCL
jgi:hypothetical protein